MKRTLGDEPKEVQAQYLKIAARYALPIFWGSGGDVAHNGTAFVLNTGEKVFGVTAAHVYHEYVKDFEAGNTAICQFGELEIPLQQRLISIGKRDSIDIATIELTASEVRRLSDRVLTGDHSTWPPGAPAIGQAAVVAGYPGVERIRRDRFDYSFGTACFNTPVSSVSEHQFVCVLERKEWIDVFGKGLPPENFNLAGISGAPVLTLIQTESGLAVWRLAGIAYQAVASELLGEVLVVNHGKLIGSDGKVSNGT